MVPHHRARFKYSENTVILNGVRGWRNVSFLLSKNSDSEAS
jgi:hypothetical protein